MADRPDPRRSERERYPVEVALQVRWGDLDAQGHVNNVMLGRLFEEGRVRFWNSMRSRGIEPSGGVVASVRIDYLREVRYVDEVAVATGVGAVGTRSVQLLQAMYQDGHCVAVAAVTDVVPRASHQPEDEARCALLADLAIIQTDDVPGGSTG